MEQKSFTLINRGMNRDLSISKVGESAAYENRNIRIIAHDDDTMLTVTNERGTSFADIELSVNEALIGWNVLNSNMVLFSHDTTSDLDRIYLVEYSDSAFTKTMLFEGDLNFDTENPIESVVYYETDAIQKIYWVDGRNVLRFMNFMAEPRLVEASDSDEEWVYPWQDDEGNYDNTYFDSNRAAKFDVSVAITKDNSGNPRANGVAQYLLTYFNKHGQETNYVWISDLVYLTPEGHGGAADGQNNNRIVLKISNLDTSYDHYRVYMVLRTTLDGQTVAYLVSEGSTDTSVTVIDDGAHLTLQDANRLLYLGSQPVIAGTMTHKDQTLFLGDLKSIGRGSYEDFEALLAREMFESDGFTAKWVSFSTTHTAPIPYPEQTSLYEYKNQLAYTSSEILTFKGGEKYRFALQFQFADGTFSDSFWIGDAENRCYPVVAFEYPTEDGPAIYRVVATCRIPPVVQNAAYDFGFRSVRLMIAEASYADRSVKAQGFVCPTVFNTWERYNERQYAMPSWILRPRNGNVSFKHFSPVANSTSSSGEIDCNYWETIYDPTPYYRIKNYGTENAEYVEEYDGVSEYDYAMPLYIFVRQGGKFDVVVVLYLAKVLVENTQSDLYTYEFNSTTVYSNELYGPDDEHKNFKIVRKVASAIKKEDATRDSSVIASEISKTLKEYNFPSEYFPSADLIDSVIDNIEVYNGIGIINPAYSSKVFQNVRLSTSVYVHAANCEGTSIESGQARWFSMSSGSSSITGDDSQNGSPSYYNKHLMFIDENTITFHSPEISYEKVNLDNAKYDIRIVGVAKISSTISDYKVNASQGRMPGENLMKFDFSGMESKYVNRCIIAWPLWRESGLTRVDPEDEKDIKDVTNSDLKWDGSIVYYWLRLWSRSGAIGGYVDKDNSDYSTLHAKTFANLHFSYETIYVNPTYQAGWTPDSIRQCHRINSNLMHISLGKEDASFHKDEYYSFNMGLDLGLPGEHKYPLFYSAALPDSTQSSTAVEEFMFSQSPVNIKYRTDSHAVVVLPVTRDSSGRYVHTILPYLYGIEDQMNISRTGTTISGALAPWLDVRSGETGPNFAELDTSYIDRLIFEDPIGTQQHPFDPDEALAAGVISLYCVKDSKAAIEPTSLAWANVVRFFTGSKVYCRVYTASYIFLVDISGFTSDIFGDVSLRTWGISIENAHLLAYCYRGASEADNYNVNYAEVVGTNYSDVRVLGSKSVNLLTGSMSDTGLYPYNDYTVYQTGLLWRNKSIDASDIEPGDKYVFIAEIYKDYESGDPSEDDRYGGVSRAAVAINRFVPASKIFPLERAVDEDGLYVYGNRGDTYFQRWDCLMTRPFSDGDINNVIDITSVMLETHINLDGRTDLQRDMKRIASIDEATFGPINNVYSQQDNFRPSRDLDSDFDTDAYRSSITWTLQKNDMADVDEWTHITLASNLKLDGDKGWVRALRRFRNSIIAFQDRGISEILFNSRTQLSTQDGVPVELANSGKVDGKRYITNKYGCVNKWSIVEGKNALYFVDNINKAFCALGEGVDNLSQKLGFSTEFKRVNAMTPWAPESSDNFISFYDRVHSDVYIMGRESQDADNFDCLVYNEILGEFTSFFDYNDVQMMTNIEDRFVSFSRHKLWYQNEGFYGDFFGTQKPFYVTYRVTPNPYTDKVWTNIDYRADFYRVLSNTGVYVEAEGNFTSDLLGTDIYQPNETFDKLRVYNEYQDTGYFTEAAEKKFRIWRYAIPRAKKVNSGSWHTKYGLDRIRNPWVNIRLEKTQTGLEKQDLMQLHDVTVKYFE